MTERNYDPELLPMIPVLPVESDWSDLPAARIAMDEMIKSATPDVLEGEVSCRDEHVPGMSGSPDVRVRIYQPSNAASSARPGVLYIHGGGFCFGSLDSEHAGAWQFSAELDAVVISVDYRLAPEHPFPAGIDDCYAALEWFASEAEGLGVDRARIAVAGSSAGGGLSAGLALMARDRGGPALCFQMLGIPELDDRLETTSMREFVDTPLWNRPNAIMSWRCYLGESEGAVSPYAAPAREEDLSGLPSAYISTMEFDPLRDEGIAYAVRLLEHGVSVELHQYPGTFHGSSLVTGAAVSKRSSREVIEAVRRALYR